MNDEFQDLVEMVNTLNRLLAIKDARIAELCAELEEVRKDRDQFESELMYLENGESM